MADYTEGGQIDLNWCKYYCPNRGNGICDATFDDVCNASYWSLEDRRVYGPHA